MTENEAIKHCYEVGKNQCGTECGKDHVQLAEWIEELLQYRKIGSVEECREAVEKQKAKKPEYLGNSEDGKILCPNCQEDLWDLKECGFSVCPYCGQAIDWTEEGAE